MELYKGIAGSPITYLTADISANQTTISIADDSALPDAPNICTIGYGEHLETIKYETKSNGVLQEVTRGIEGTPQAWQAGTEVARFFTAYDHNAIIEDFVAHKAESANKHITESGSNNDGYYIKFDDGTMICYGTFYREAPVTSAIGGMFRTNAAISPPSPPASFIGRPLRLFNPIWDSANTDAVIFGILEQSGDSRVDIFTPISHSLLKIDIGYLYIGRWK